MNKTALQEFGEFIFNDIFYDSSARIKAKYIELLEKEMYQIVDAYVWGMNFEPSPDLKSFEMYGEDYYEKTYSHE
jgi:hypothetical protein